MRLTINQLLCEELNLNLSLTIDKIKELGVYPYFKTGLVGYCYIRLDHLPDFNNLNDFREFLIDENNNDLFHNKGVYSKKLGKLLLLLNNELTETEIESVVSKIKLNLENVESTFEEFENDIDDLYSASDISSCMTGSDSNYTEVYNDIKQVSYLRQVNSDNEEISRSLVWKGVIKINEDKSEEIINVCDRIYSKNSLSYEKHAQHALSLGYYVRHSQSHGGYAELLNPAYKEREDLRLRIDLDIDLAEYEYLPYFDTFFISKKVDDRYSLTNYAREGGESLRGTDGQNPYNLLFCPYCDAQIDEDNHTRVDDYHCDNCAVFCNKVGEYYAPDSDNYADRIYNYDYPFLSEDGFVYLKDNLIFIHCIDQYMSKSDLARSNYVLAIDIDEYHDISDCYYNEERGDCYYHRDEYLKSLQVEEKQEVLT